MKRKNLFLKNTVLLSLFGIFFLLTFYAVENSNLQNTIGDAYYQNVQNIMLSVQKRMIKENKLVYSVQEAEADIPRDMVALLVRGEETFDLNPDGNKKALSDLVRYHLLANQKGEDFLEQNRNSLKRILYRDERNRPRSFYLSFHDAEVNGGEGTLLLAVDSSLWDTYLLHSKTLLFSLILIYLAFIFYFHRQQQLKIYDPIREMTEVAFRYSENSFGQQILIKENDELGDLATALNKLGKNLEASSLINMKEKSLLSLVFDSLAVGVIYLDEDLTVTILNSLGRQYYTSYLKRSSARLNGQMEKEYQQLIREVFETGSGNKAEVQENQSIFEIRLSPLLSEAEEVEGVLLMVENVTTARKLAAIREDLITNVSHDFRTPLATIKGYSEAIIDDIAETQAEKNEMAKIIFDEANELNKTIDSLLNLSRINAGYEQLHLQTIHLETFFNNIRMRFSEKLRRKQIQCTLQIEKGLEYYQMDGEKMSVVIYNLIDNAIRYSSEARGEDGKYIRIEVKLDALVDEILFEIADNGIGINKESIPYIFERFYKDDKSRTRGTEKGTGIGLSLVASIVKEHAGQVTVDSVIDKGTNFTIRLPYKETILETNREG